MGFDSIAPSLAYPGKGAFLLCHTSNPGGVNMTRDNHNATICY